MYQLPPRTSNKGYRAADWKLDKPVWTGTLRVISKGAECFVRLVSVPPPSSAVFHTLTLTLEATLAPAPRWQPRRRAGPGLRCTGNLVVSLS